MKCPHCARDIKQRLVMKEAARIEARSERRALRTTAARLLGSITSDAKAEAARENGKKGGRPRNDKRKEGGRPKRNREKGGTHEHELA